MAVVSAARCSEGRLFSMKIFPFLVSSSLLGMLRILFTILLVLLLAWSVVAMSYRLTLPAWLSGLVQVIWVVAAVGVLYLLWTGRPVLASAICLLMAALFFTWWSSIRPSSDRIWADDVAQSSVGELVGRELRLENVRNFRWRSDTDYDVAWEARTYDIDKLSSLDLMISTWGLPGIAHVILSFGFEDGRFLAFSVEIRRQKGEVYSSTAGFFREYELSIVMADELDVVRVRTNVRDEDIRLYKLTVPPATRRSLLLSYVAQANLLAAEPRFYNTITANCTSVVFDMMQHITGHTLPLDYRLLLTAFLPEYVARMGGMLPDIPMAELHQKGRITQRAREAQDARDFSRRIRMGVPGWERI